MKKTIIIVALILLSLLFINSYSASIQYEDNYEKEYTIEFDNLTNKNLNFVFSNLDIFMISIDVDILGKEYTFYVNTYLNKDIERVITRSVIENLILDNKREEAAIIEIKGYRVVRSKLLCSLRTLNVIKSRL